MSATRGQAQHLNAPAVAVDIGNTRLKLGMYSLRSGSAAGLPQPDRTLDVPIDQLDAIESWCEPWRVEQLSWWVGSVQREFTTRLLAWLRDHREPQVTLLSCRDLNLKTELPQPDRAGIDRLLAAVAANCVRPANRNAVVVDVGTAVTVDLVRRDGTFCGGAILPGVAMAARALHEFTDLLPLVPMAELADAPPALGNDTISAMRSGLFWGAVGAVRELIVRMSPSADPPLVILTGGAAQSVASLLAQDALFEPHLVLAGIALTALSHLPQAAEDSQLQ